MYNTPRHHAAATAYQLHGRTTLPALRENDLVMNPGQLFALLPLVAAAAYALLLVALVVRGDLRTPSGKWFLFVLAGSIFWSMSLIALPPSVYHHLNAKILAAVATLLAAATAAYAGWNNERRWLNVGVIALLVAIVLDFIWPYPPWISERRGAWQLSFGEFIAICTWATLHISMIYLLYRDIGRTRLPWHANRILHWGIFVVANAFAELLVLMPNHWLTALGEIIRFIAIAGLFRAITSHRIFDVRARLRRGAAFLVIGLLSAIPAAIVLTLTFWLAGNTPLRLVDFSLVALVVIAAGFMAYRPFHTFLERIVFRFLVGREFNTGAVVRQYSQAIARTLYVEQLAQVMLDTLSDLLDASRGALLLVTPSAEGYDLDVVPGPHHNLHGARRLPPHSQFVEELTTRHSPLLQYDLDFNPKYDRLTPQERDWLVTQNMEVYVPIHDGPLLNSIITLGPKKSGQAYRANELELMQVLAEQSLVALQNARLYSELNEQNERIRSLNADLREQYERLEILDRMKSDFITIASHELRTPLTQIKGYTDILTHLNDIAPLDQEKAREIMGHISRASGRLETLITAMLDASELEVTGIELMKSPARLEMVVQNAVDPLARALDERHITLNRDNLAAIRPLEVDFQRLVQAFGNIIANAVKYTPDYGVIDVSAHIVPGAADNQDFVEVVIADTGIGIDPQYHELIFEKFFRIGNPELHSTGATKFKGGGPGLGLHIAKGVIEAHGGRIWVESSGEDEEKMPGSRFHILLPLVEASVFTELESRKTPNVQPQPGD